MRWKQTNREIFSHPVVVQTEINEPIMGHLALSQADLCMTKLRIQTAVKMFNFLINNDDHILEEIHSVLLLRRKRSCKTSVRSLDWRYSRM